MTQQHTPGPWRSRDHCIEASITHAGGINDATMLASGVWNAGDRALMAAAPDMLAALNMALCLPIRDRDDDIRRKILAAIAKARGE